MNLSVVIEKAKTSRFRLWLLNRLLYRVIPFNKPHKFEIVAIGDDEVTIKVPYKHKNLNHIKGLHACALATLAEYSTGFMLISKLNPREYRIIMQKIEVDYHYQGKTDATCTFELRNEQLSNEVIEPLKHQDAIVYICEPKIYDKKRNLLATGKIHWQIKSWEKVRTKL